MSRVARICSVTVVSPVPYCPPLPGFPAYTRFRGVKSVEDLNGIRVYHPRFMVGPGYTLHNLEASAYYWGVRRLVDELWEKDGFDIIHGLFGYPDGVVAARFGERFDVPVIITDHASWRPWMDRYPRVRKQAVAASQRSTFHLAPSSFAIKSIERFTGPGKRFRIFPNGVDPDLFSPHSDHPATNAKQILYVGIMRHVKGVDILLTAMRKIVDQHPELNLVLVGGGFYSSYSVYENQVRSMAVELGLENNVRFVGMRSPEEVAQFMRESAVLVVPSRTETFGSVLIEALASGIPVVSTKCGGPEDFVTEKLGALVPKADPVALAQAILNVIKNRERFEPSRLRKFAIDNYSWDQLAKQKSEIYAEALGLFRQRKAS
jgi:glycosyltransferase involved in cell wall biosynthesis